MLFYSIMEDNIGGKATDRRGAILAAALRCFNENGIEGAAIGEICRRSGASIGSVYHHFGSKEGIAAALLAEGLHRNARQLEQRLRRARGARQGVRTLVESLAQWVVANPEWARFIYTITSSRLAQRSSASLQAVNAFYAKTIDDYFKVHVDAGAFRRLPKDCFASLVIGPVHDYARRWLNRQVSSPPTAHIDEFASAAWNSVRNPRKS